MDAPSAGRLVGILQIAIPVKDIARATDFYRDKLGLAFLMAAPAMAFFDCGGTRIYLDANPGTLQAGGNSLVYFRSDDIEAANARFEALGVEVHLKPQVIARLPGREVWLMWIRDSESNLLGVMQERPTQA